MVRHVFIGLLVSVFLVVGVYSAPPAKKSAKSTTKSIKKNTKAPSRKSIRGTNPRTNKGAPLSAAELRQEMLNKMNARREKMKADMNKRRQEMNAKMEETRQNIRNRIELQRQESANRIEQLRLNNQTLQVKPGGKSITRGAKANTVKKRGVRPVNKNVSKNTKKR